MSPCDLLHPVSSTALGSMALDRSSRGIVLGQNAYITMRMNLLVASITGLVAQGHHDPGGDRKSSSCHLKFKVVSSSLKRSVGT